MTPKQLIAIVDEVHGILRLKGDGRIHLELPASWAQIGGRAEPTTPTSFGSDLRYASVQGDAHPFAHVHHPSPPPTNVIRVRRTVLAIVKRAGDRWASRPVVATSKKTEW